MVGKIIQLTYAIIESSQWNLLILLIHKIKITNDLNATGYQNETWIKKKNSYKGIAPTINNAKTLQKRNWKVPWKYYKYKLKIL
jgi:hypothetical protein